MDLIPLDNLEPMEDNSYLSDRAIFARSRSIERRLNNPNKRETLKEKMDAVDDLIGGVSRRAIWADESPKDFYTLQARLHIADQVKKVAHQVQVISPSLPRTGLDEAIEAEFTETPSVPS